MTDHRIAASWLLPNAADPAVADRATIRSPADRIAAVEARCRQRRSLVLPALANAHDHARVVRLSQVGSFDVPLEAWLPYLALVPAVDPWLASAVAFGRIARGGVGVDHGALHARPGSDRLSDRGARSGEGGPRCRRACRRSPCIAATSIRWSTTRTGAARAALARGLRLHHAAVSAAAAAGRRAGGDGRGGGRRHRRARRHRPIRAGRRAVVHRRACCGGSARRRRAPAAASTCTCSKRATSATGRTGPIPQGIVRYLDEIGLVNERVSFAHCIWLRPDEMELIAARGATIVINTSSNFIVSSGLAPVGEMLRRGCRVAMGLDGLSFDEDEDALARNAAAYVVHKAAGFDIRVRRDDLLRIAFENGRFAVTGAATAGASRKVRRLTCWCSIGTSCRPSWSSRTCRRIELLFAKARQEHVKQLFVAGREIVRDGAVTGVDLPALRGRAACHVAQVEPNDGRHSRRHARTARRTALALLRSALLRVSRPHRCVATFHDRRALSIASPPRRPTTSAASRRRSPRGASIPRA